MSAIGTITGPLIVPQTAPVAPASQTEAVVQTTSTPPTLEERLADALMQIGGPASSVGLSGLYRPQAPGDVSILLAQVSLTLEATNDQSNAMRGRLAFSALSQAFRSLDPTALDEARKTELASKGEAGQLRTELQNAHNGWQTQRIAQLEAITDPKEKEKVAAELAGLKSQVVESAKSMLDKTATLLQKEIARLPEGDRRDAVQAQLNATNDRRASLNGADAYSKVQSAYSANDSLLGTKVDEYNAAAAAASSSVEQLLSAITAIIANVAASITARDAVEGPEKHARNTAIDELLTEILKASIRADEAFIDHLDSSNAAGRLEQQTARNDGTSRAGLAKLMEALLAAVADLLSALSGLDPLTIQAPATQPGRSRVRLDV